jgi:hypothetical protein
LENLELLRGTAAAKPDANIAKATRNSRIIKFMFALMDWGSIFTGSMKISKCLLALPGRRDGGEEIGGEGDALGRKIGHYFIHLLIVSAYAASVFV